ncbi:hypothetical protein [Paracoccus seriniphilus]|uniref:Uncharacterized protein n=1 Tax=Paracoccus seriniphilus TaxID=184748 RepID=A0A239Q2I3_9RHOB|nr:hypothetical protein [Paracoccus seriniphilus]WCR13212.1 hypothetical protein JHW44_09690 [Paracoccus seriniphilus]SNT76705.1 hypothetical protein SAMN05444959_12512 [Paracoccus seriniphilus]
MTRYAYLDPDDGSIAIDDIAPAGITSYAVADNTDPNRIYIKDDAVHAVPLRPDHPFVVFDVATEQWVDPRDPAQIAVDLHLARYATNTDKNLVFYRLSAAGAYPASELADDSTFFPATVEEYLNSLPPAEHDMVKAALKYEPKIWRLHPHLVGDAGITGFVPWLAVQKGITITEDQLDQIFEVPVPEPIYAGE